ncbi:T9SS type B sorting domain-containing protein [Mucilaginibacter myungsuensis]|uniref:Gliding motility-associated C-terminal domain-containing protein n=1 Tax=Mucilaginibacter myungsuensis TaxID=649104 RepID=A0A929PXP8_9SPHI|nr:gliding motility-associated C-terminal domain-containing protein [Mucilaginibacter myungsuensis]MBE9664083.1 gliding motility-associated C-terminal domain-containing protein [Mucilaginibacter myungsuensis]MDN3601262.1 gliding motility-associated C-terminal domain-containing protein [Mucilaginibacter myungsuensis]
MTKLLLIISLLLLITNARAQNQTVTDGGTTRPVDLGAGECVYKWTNSNPSIGLAAGGNGNIPAFKAINKSTADITATITVTPVRRARAYIFGTDMNLSIIDPVAAKLIKSFGMPYGDYGLAISNDGNYLYVTTSSTNDAAMFATDGTLLINDPIKFGNGASPRGIAINSVDSRVYIATKNPINNTGILRVVDAKTFKPIKQVDIEADPYAVLISPDDNRIYVAQRGANKVAVIDAATNTLIDNILVGQGPALMAITRDGRWLYVGNTDGTSVSRVNTATGAVDDITVGRAPSGMAFAPGDRFLYMVNNAEVSVSVLDVQTGNIVKVIDLPGGKGPVNIAVTPDGTKAYVVNINGQISIINTATHTLDKPIFVSQNAFSFGNFMSEGITCPPQTFTITVQPNLPPQVSVNGDLSSLNTTYGSASASAVANVNGAYLKGALVFTAPNGAELSLDNISFSSTITLTPGGDHKATNVPMYVRLTKNIPAGYFSADIIITGGGGLNSKAPIKGVVKKAALGLVAHPITKKYGQTLTDGPGFKGFTASGLQNTDAIASVTVTYGPAGPPAATAKNYVSAVKVSTPVGPNFDPDNYTIVTSAAADAMVEKVDLEIKANNISRAIGKPNPPLTISYTGFVNNETSAQLLTLPIISTTATGTSAAGKYPISISGATSDNYRITHTAGVFTIYSGAQSIVIPNAFTPNGDNINDRWNIADLQYYPSCRVHVFDRRGSLLYYSAGYGLPWDGTSNGSPLPSGTYYYLIEFSATERSSGAVTIVR